MDFATLGIRIDSTGVDEASQKIGRLESATERASQSATRLERSSAVAYDALMNVVPRRLPAELERTSHAMFTAGLSAKQYSQAMRLLPVQLTDVATSLASGMPIWMVAIQQGGQIRDMFGGIGNSLRAIGSIVTPARLAIGGAAAGAALLAKAFADGEEEGTAFARAIALTGNAAGVTTADLRGMAEELDNLAGVTEGSAAAALARLVTTGKVTRDNLENVAAAVLAMQRDLQVPVEESVKLFAKFGEDPVKAAQQLNEQFNFLTREVYDQARALKAQGKEAEAAALLQEAFANAMINRSQATAEELGYLQRIGRGVTETFKEMWDTALGFGRGSEIEKLQEDLEKLQNARGARQPFTGGAQFRDEDREEQRLAGEIARREAQARDAADKARELREQLRREQIAERTASARSAAAASFLEGELDDSLNAQENYSRELEALYDRRLISERYYYDERADLVRVNTETQKHALQEQIRLTQQENALLSGREGSEADVIRSNARIVDLKRQIDQLDRNQIAQLRDLQSQEAALGEQRKRSYDISKSAVEHYLDALQRQYDSELALAGAGDKARQKEQGRNTIDDRFEDQERELAGELRRREITQEEYNQQIEILHEFHDKAIDSFENYWSRLDEQQGDFWLGAREALSDYLDEAGNLSAQGEQIGKRLFGGLTEELTNLATTGKANFSDLARSVVADLIRMQIQALLTRLAMSFLGGFGGGAGAIGGLGAGGGAALGGGGVMVAASGTNYVQKDNQRALLHKGEAVIPRKFNPWAGGRMPSMGGGGVTVNLKSDLRLEAGVSGGEFRAVLFQHELNLKQRIPALVQDAIRRGNVRV